jgi:hypothetical protein
MIHCKTLNKSFSNKEEMFKELVANEKTILASKMAHIYNSEEWIAKNGIKGEQVITEQKEIEKAFEDAEKKIKFDNNYYYFVVNSANYLDSHEDVHLDGNWNKSVKDKQGKVWLIWHHEFGKVENIIGFPEDIESFTAKVAWTLLGKSYEGETYCLVYKILKTKIQSEKIKQWLEEGRKLQLSVRMRYREILFCMKSENPEYAKQNKNYNDIYPLIVNKDEFPDEIDYFFGIKQAENVLESSILPFGSNSATAEISTQSETKEEQSKDTLDNEQSDDTQKKVEIPTEKRKLSII